MSTAHRRPPAPRVSDNGNPSNNNSTATQPAESPELTALIARPLTVAGRDYTIKFKQIEHGGSCVINFIRYTSAAIDEINRILWVGEIAREVTQIELYFPDIAKSKHYANRGEAFYNEKGKLNLSKLINLSLVTTDADLGNNAFAFLLSLFDSLDEGCFNPANRLFRRPGLKDLSILLAVDFCTTYRYLHKIQEKDRIAQSHKVDQRMIKWTRAKVGFDSLAFGLITPQPEGEPFDRWSFRKLVVVMRNSFPECAKIPCKIKLGVPDKLVGFVDEFPEGRQLAGSLSGPTKILVDIIKTRR